MLLMKIHSLANERVFITRERVLLSIRRDHVLTSNSPIDGFCEIVAGTGPTFCRG